MVVSLIHGAYYLLPDGTSVQALLSVTSNDREWQLVDTSSLPCYLLMRDGRSFLRFVAEEQGRGLILAPSDLQMADLRWVGFGNTR